MSASVISNLRVLACKVIRDHPTESLAKLDPTRNLYEQVPRDIIDADTSRDDYFEKIGSIFASLIVSGDYVACYGTAFYYEESGEPVSIAAGDIEDTEVCIEGGCEEDIFDCYEGAPPHILAIIREYVDGLIADRKCREYQEALEAFLHEQPGFADARCVLSDGDFDCYQDALIDAFEFLREFESGNDGKIDDGW